ELEEHLLVLAHPREQRSVRQSALVAAHAQLTAIHGELDPLFTQLEQKIGGAQRTTSLISSADDANSDSLGAENSAFMDPFKPSRRMRSMSVTADSEWPPSSKKSS